MPVPLPDSLTTDLVPPGREESVATARCVASVVAPREGLTALQRILLESVFTAMTGHLVALDDVEPGSSVELAEVLRRRNLAYRTRIVQIMLLGAFVLRPLPESVVDQVGSCARELCVDESLIGVARRFASGSLGLAAFDFERNGYTAEWRPESASELHTTRELASAWELVVDDPELARRWSELEHLPKGTLGRGVADLYRSRGFVFPGLPGSAPPLLAQHDWVHVLADYGTTVESELEVFAFIARANDDMRAFSLLAMVVSLFETGIPADRRRALRGEPGTPLVARGRRDPHRRCDAEGGAVSGLRPRHRQHRLSRSRLVRACGSAGRDRTATIRHCREDAGGHRGGIGEPVGARRHQ
jgi:hypothetical protein